MRCFILLLLFCHVSSPVKHSLRYFLTASSGVPNFPELLGAILVDDVLVAYCDSNINMVEPKQDWGKKINENYPQHFERYTHECLEVQPHFFKATIDNFSQRYNQTEDVHILQQYFGCEWDDETGETTGFNQFGYNGEDFLALDLKTWMWIAPKPWAVSTKLKWDADEARMTYNDHNLNQMIPEWLKMYLAVGKSSLLRTERPSVSLLQKSPSSPVSCHATGFYPDRAMMFWRKDGEEIHEDVDLGEILPNHDGSFQMSVDLNVSSVTPEDWSRYECVFHLSGVKDDIITKLDKAAIRTNWVSPSEFPAVVGVVVGLLLLTVCITGLFIWRRNNNKGFRRANFIDAALN
ncbi:major histocompatibility complex class I-related gene protein-like isoform X2 [Plectropomus leopardus]|uniref:major histocompatibility complex class I-related gene protein-like isoform X2 n=1 Tax=Plectropomus leopardus TaxID=160734 RepID=UPI001C4CED15|nr:major histocompatibility complex class I-related gene protein-like isoform X2 [Plectropomus leopardus]